MSPSSAMRARLHRVAVVGLLSAPLLLVTGASPTSAFPGPLVMVAGVDNQDGDGLLDALDADDDNDGLLDVVETPILDENGLLARWSGDANDPGGSPSGHFEPAGINGGLVTAPLVTAGVGDLTAGAGVGLVGNGADSFDVSGVESASAAAARTADDYVEVTFTTTTTYGDLSDWAFTTEAEAYDVAVDLVIEPGGIAEVFTLAEDITLAATSAEQRQAFTNSLLLEPDGDYAVRFYLYNAGVDDAVNLDDLQLFANARGVPDLDTDGVPDHLDLDTDNDGITDLVESGQNQGVVDAANDGRVDGGENGRGVPTAANGGSGVAPLNTDGDPADVATADFRDIDADADGIPDAVEAFTTALYVEVDSTNNATDNGVNDSDVTVPVDTDGDGTPDYIDTDSDDDTIADIRENGDVDVLDAADADGDGLDDAFDDVGPAWAPDDGVPTATIVTALGDVDGDAGAVDGSGTMPERADVDFRDVFTDIAVAKQVAVPRDTVAPRFALDYTFVIENTGTENLTDLTLVDDVATAFGTGFIGIDTTPAITDSDATTDPAVNTIGYDGTNDLFAGGGLLEPGQSITVTVSIEVDPTAGGAPLPFTNQATAGGDDAVAATVSDLSDQGGVPDSDNGAGGSDDATVAASAGLRVATSVSAPVAAVSGTVGHVDITYTHVVLGAGFESLDTLSVTQDLPTAFGGAFIDVVAGPTVTNTSASSAPDASGTFAATGTGDLLAGDGTDDLRPGQEFTIELTVEIDPDAAPGSLPFTDQVTGAGDPGTGAVTDLSDSGSDPNTSNVGEPGDTGGSDDPTAIDLPLIGVALDQTAAVAAASGTPGNFDVTYVAVVQNRGSVNLTDLSIIDDASTRLGSAFVGVTTAPTVTPLDSTTAPAADPAYDGTGDLLAGALTDVLEPGQQFSVEFEVEIDPDATGAPLTLTNQATASGDDVAGATVSDVSDDGPDPDSDNGTAGESDATPVSVAGLGVAKSVTGATPAASGTAGNVDIEFLFVIANVGTEPLDTLSLTDDMNTAFGAAFVGIAEAPVVDDGTATAAPDADGTFSGTGDLLDGAVTDVLDAGERFEVSVTVEATLASFPADPENQATASADDPADVVVTDLSDSGTDPTGVNAGAAGDTGGGADPTPISADAIAVAKSVDDVEAASSGTPGAFDVTYRFVVANIGLSSLDQLSLVDDLDDQLGGAFIRVVTAPAVDDGTATSAPAANPGYDGTNDLLVGGAADDLAAGQAFEVEVTIEVDPTASGAVLPLTNQATASGENAGGDVVSDLSDSGTDPTTDNPGSADHQGTADDPTVLPLPAIGAAKAVIGDVIDNRDGTFSLTYRIIVENVGEVTLSDIEITENLAATFADAESFVVDDFRGTDLSPAPDFDGAANFELLTGADSLAPDAIGSIELDVTVEPGLAPGPFLNTATASALGPRGPRVADDSADGLDADPDNDNQVLDDNDPTPVDFRPESGLGVAKELIAGPVVDGNGGFTMTFRIRVENTESEAINDLQVFDDLDATFPGLSPTIVGIESADFTVGSFTDGRLLAGTDTIAAGESGFVDLAVRVVPDDNFGPFSNTAVVSGRLADDTDVSDVSDSGSDADPMATNAGEPGDTGGSDDPTTFVLASLSGFDLDVDAASIRVNETTNQVEWSVFLENNGPDTAPGEIRVTVRRPSSNTLSGPVVPTGWTVERPSDGSVVFVRSAQLAADDTARFTISTTAATSFDGLVSLSVSVVGADGTVVEAISSNNSDSATIRLAGTGGGSALPNAGSNAWFSINLAVALLLFGVALRSIAFRRRQASA
ncbi:MAG: beta strand repeat-containing protein [Ilumatobacter sp.]